MLDLNKSDFNHFNEKGYLIKNFNDENFIDISNNLKIKISEYFKNNLNNIKRLGGYKSGNLNFTSKRHCNDLLNLLIKNNFKSYFEYLTGDNFSDYEVIFGGNINLPKSKNQFFHTDGKWEPRMLIINFATTEINNLNGPTEIIEGSHKVNYPYWKFVLKSFYQAKKKVFLKKGEFIFREHRLWHRGTENKSLKYREMIGIMFIKRKSKNKINQDPKNNELIVSSNIFGTSFKERIKEFIFIYLKIIYFFYKILISFKKTI